VTRHHSRNQQEVANEHADAHGTGEAAAYAAGWMVVVFAGCDATCINGAVVVSSSVDSSVSLFSSLALASVALAVTVSSALLQ